MGKKIYKNAEAYIKAIVEGKDSPDYVEPIEVEPTEELKRMPGWVVIVISTSALYISIGAGKWKKVSNGTKQ